MASFAFDGGIVPLRFGILVLLSEEQKATLRAVTAPAAKALAEDLNHVRDVLSRRSTSTGEIRRLSAVIRRLLIDGDLLDVASPRVGKLLVQACDCTPFYEYEKHGEVLFFASGGAPVFGLNLHAMMYFRAPPGGLPNLPAPELKLITMRIDNFLAQRVMCMNGEWISRRGAIKHIANYGSGIHSKTPDGDEATIISLMRQCATYTVEGGKVKAHMLPHFGKDSFPAEFSVYPPWEAPFPVDTLDPVLLEVLAAGSFLVNSPDILALEAAIAAEFSPPP